MKDDLRPHKGVRCSGLTSDLWDNFHSQLQEYHEVDQRTTPPAHKETGHAHRSWRCPDRRSPSHMQLSWRGSADQPAARS